VVDNASKLSRRLSALDASFLYFERPSQLLHVASVLTFEGVLDYERVVADLDARIHLIPRYAERVMSVPFGLGHPTWEPDPAFDIRNHVHRRTLRPPGKDRQLAELCAALYVQPLNRSKPLWELYVVDGYHGHRETPEWVGTTDQVGRSAASDSPRSALFVKVHHCMIDGISGVQLLPVLLDVSPKSPPVPAPGFLPRRPLPGFASRLLDAAVDGVTTGVSRAITALPLLLRPRLAMQELRDTADAVISVVRTAMTGAQQAPFNGPVANTRGLAWITFSLNETKAIKNSLGGSVNDVVMAVISGALRRVLDQRGMNPDRMELRAVVPVNLRDAHEHLKLGNRLSIMVAPLPVGIYDPVERLRQVRAATALLKSKDESAKMRRLVQLLDLIPPSVQQLFGWVRRPAAPVNTICTNVPGPPIALYMQGMRLERMMPFAPLAEGIGVAFAIMSYADTLTIGITADAALMHDLRDVVGPLHESFEELWAATGLARVSEQRPVRSALRRRRGAASGASEATAEAPVIGLA
jgi:WS/DGAT/MGAT family acyltransferase